MLEEKKVLAVIQARGGSKGIPKKNIFLLSGHPLIAYTITAALESKFIDELVVSTDSEEIAEIAKSYGACAPFLRPDELSGDTVASVDSLHHAVLKSEEYFQEKFDLIIELPCVAPLRNSEDIDGALSKLVNTGANSVISVANTGEKHPVRLKRIVDDQITDFCSEYPEPAKGSRRQDLEPCYIRNGAIYSMTRDTLIDQFTRHGSDSRPYLMPDERSVNIDSWMDLRVVELMIKDGQCTNRPRLYPREVPRIIARNKEPHIVVTTPLHFVPSFLEQLKCDEHISIVPSQDVSADPGILRDVHGWICSPCPEYVIDESILRHAPVLKVIVTPSTGSNHIDAEYCSRRGIKVVSMRGSPMIGKVYASSEFTLALMLAVVRNLPQAESGARSGFWRDAEDLYRGVELDGKTLGIIGFGRIGSNLGRYAASLNMKVIAYDPFVEIDESQVTQYGDYASVLSQADIVAVCVHLSEDTKAMVDESWFSLMKMGCYFINTSRGEVIDEDALIRNLKSGKVRAAGVDVISDEQRGDFCNHPLINYAKNNSNLIVTPHIAGLTVESETKTGSYAYLTIREELGLFDGN